MSAQTGRTLILPVHAWSLDNAVSQASLKRAAQILQAGGTVAFPTETVYGLGANALSLTAVEKIFAAKQRPSWDPLIVHVAGTEMLEMVTHEISAVERALMAAFWPGPLTLLLRRNERVPLEVSAGRPKIGVRMPKHPVANALIALAGLPIAAPSANSFGRTSPTTAQHVLEDLDGRIDAVLDGGATSLGLESTVVDAGANPPTLYRHGMVSLEQLQKMVPELVSFREAAVGSGSALASLPESLPSPGIGLRHYAPRARLVLVEGANVEQALRDRVAEAADQPVGVLLPEDFQGYSGERIFTWRWGRWTHPEELARTLFAGLRALDGEGVELIFCPLPEAGGIGAALRDRLQKAAKPAAD